MSLFGGSSSSADTSNSSAGAQTQVGPAVALDVTGGGKKSNTNVNVYTSDLGAISAGQALGETGINAGAALGFRGIEAAENSALVTAAIVGLEGQGNRELLAALSSDNREALSEALAENTALSRALLGDGGFSDSVIEFAKGLIGDFKSQSELALRESIKGFSDLSREIVGDFRGLSETALEESLQDVTDLASRTVGGEAAQSTDVAKTALYAVGAIGVALALAYGVGK